MIRPDVALLDSGVHAGHPHLRGLCCEGLALDGGSWRDVHGHGTACAAALHHAGPALSVLAVRVLDERLRARAEDLAAAIDRAVAEGARVVNLSLGSPRPESARVLGPAVARAATAGSLCVAAVGPCPTWPAELPGVLGALACRRCPPDALLITPSPRRFRLHGWPRPGPGRGPQANPFGASFAAARLSARVALLLRAGLPPAEVAEALRHQASTQLCVED